MGTPSLLVCILPQQKNVHLHNSEGHRKYLKLMEKIPEDAEATVVLVGKRWRVETPRAKRDQFRCLFDPAVCALPPEGHLDILYMFPKFNWGGSLVHSLLWLTAHILSVVNIRGVGVVIFLN